MNRRNFLTLSCKLCTLSGSALSFSFLLNSCSSILTYKVTASSNIISVPLTAFGPEETKKIIRTEDMKYDILLLNLPLKEPYAILMKCTHIENRIFVTNTGFSCNLHGSRFLTDGSVVQGPATEPLQRFKVLRNENSLDIYLT